MEKKHVQRKKKSMFKNRDGGYHLDDMNQEGLSIHNQHST